MTGCNFQGYVKKKALWFPPCHPSPLTLTLRKPLPSCALWMGSQEELRPLAVSQVSKSLEVNQPFR